MITYRRLIESIRQSTGVIARFNYLGEKIEVRENFDVYIEGELVCSSTSLSESKNLAKLYIDSRSNTSLSENTIAEKLLLFREKKDVTTTLVEFYKEKLENREFFIDEVITSLKTPNSFGKYEYELNDGSVVAIDEETQLIIQDLFKDKYDIVSYMRESIDSFKQVMREIRS